MDWLLPESPDELAALLARRGSGDAPLVATGAAGPPDRGPGSPETAASRGATDAPRAADAAGAASGSGAGPDAADPGPDAPSAVVSTARLAGVTDLRPRDLTVTVGAGTRVAELLERLRREGAWIPLDGPAAALSVGGAVACALPGPYDAGHGDLRRQLLACRMATPGGDLVRWGRGVMKNVAGYGMLRAVAGSFGRLGVIHRATFRLWPAPGERRTAVLRPRDDGDALEAAARIARSGFDAEVRPDAVVWRRAGGDERLEVRLAGTAESVELRLNRLRSWTGDAGLEVGEARPTPFPGDASGGEAGPYGRGRAAGASAAWASVGRRGFGPAARAGARALGDALVSLLGYPLSGDVRFAWRPAGPWGSGSGDGGAADAAGPGAPSPSSDPTTGGRTDGAGPDAPPAGPARRLLDALEGVPVRVERGRRAELAAVRARRDEAAGRLESRVTEALGGRRRCWLAGYL